VEAIRRLLAGNGELPLLPASAARILEEIRLPAGDTQRAVDLVRHDPVLASAVLRVANSAMYGGQVEISDLSCAMVRIGLRQARNLVLALALRSRLSDTGAYGNAGPEMMDHSLAVALGAKLIAGVALLDREMAFLCGLLHDFGRLALVKSLREASGVRSPGFPAELAALVDEHHEEAGALLATRWGLPDAVVLVARHHHHAADAGEQRPLIAAVSLADALAAELGLSGAAVSKVRPDHPAARILGMGDEQIDAWRKTLPGLFSTTRAAMTG
jgi:putative nucleotidyltransferase with HDIG domain